MKILLKNTRTNLFAKRDGKWVPDAHEATDFKMPLEAISFSETRHLSDIALVTWEDGRPFEFPLTCQEIKSMTVLPGE